MSVTVGKTPEQAKWILALSVLPWFALVLPLERILFDMRLSGVKNHVWGLSRPIFNPAQIGQLFVLIGEFVLLFAWLTVFRSLLLNSSSRKKTCAIAMIIFPFVSFTLYWTLNVSGALSQYHIVASAPVGHRLVSNTFAVYVRDILGTGTWILSVLVALYALSLAPASKFDVARGRFVALAMMAIYLLLGISSFVAFMDIRNARSVTEFASSTVFNPRGWWLTLPIAMILSTLLALWAFVATRSPRNKEMRSPRG